MANGFNPSAAARHLSGQGKSHAPHGPGGLPPAPKGGDGGRNEKYNPKGAVAKLNRECHNPPNNAGPGAGKTV